MDGGLAGDFHQAQLPRQSCYPKDRATACWQRSVKRKYYDVSLDGLQGNNSGNTGIWKGSCSSEVAQGTITSGQRLSCSPREVSIPITDTNIDEVLEKSYSQRVNLSELHLPTSYPSKSFLLADDEDFKTLDMQNTPTLDFEVPCMAKGNGRNVFSTKTATLATVPSKSQTSLEVDPVQESAIQNEVFLLREALKSERKSLCNLYIELEKERSASATAANEAMAMIARLQEEKAAVLMEACQYRRVYEEREAHNQEAITLLKDILLNKEDILLAFQEQMEAYRKMFLRMESGGFGEGRGQGNLLEEGMEKEGLLFLESQGTISSSPVLERKYGRGNWQNLTDKSLPSASKQIEGERFTNQELSGDWSKHLVTDGVRMNISSYHDDITNGYDGKQVEDVAIGDWPTEERIPNDPSRSNHLLDESICWERERFKEVESVSLAHQEQSLEEASVSILARVTRLEKQFEYLGKTQEPEDERLIYDVKALRNEATGDVCPEKGASSSWNSDREALYNKRQWYPEKIQRNSNNLSSESLVEDWEKGYHRELSPLPKTGTETQVCETRQYRMDVHKVRAIPEDVCSESGGDSGEGIHDIYEVHDETKDSFIHHSECAVKDYRKCRKQVESLAATALQEPEKELCEGMAAMTNKVAPLSGEPEGCGAERDEKLLVEMNPLEVKDIHKSTAEKEVHQLTLRLQALEGERGFMKQAIESLRKENTDLKLLQEIAQQIRELKGDVKQTNQPKQTLQQDQLSFLSFLKGILPFTGVQGTVNNEWSRFVCPFSKNSEISFGEQNHGGLIHLLEKPQSRRSACVTRGLKVRLPAGETGHTSKNQLVQLPALYG